MRTAIAIAAGALAVAGCAGNRIQQISLTPATAESLSGREISLSERPLPRIGAVTSSGALGNALFGPMIGEAMNSSIVERANEMLRKSNMPNPAGQLAQELGDALAARYGARIAATRTPLSTDDAAEAAKNAAASDFVLDVNNGWTLHHFALSPGKYKIFYLAKSRLINAKTGQVLAEGGCSAPRNENAEQAPTYDELFANNAERMKKELAKATEYCAAEFASKMFSFDIAQYRTARTAVAPAPSKPEPVIQTQPAAIEANKALPVAGTLWRYRYEDRRFGRHERSFSVQLASAAGTSVVESFSSGGEEQTYASNSQEVNFALRRVEKEPIYELAPYLLAHLRGDAAPAERPVYPGPGNAKEWRVRITDMQRERVSVPAGEFDAIRLRVTGENPSLLHATSSAHAVNMAANEFRTQRFEYTVWYVPEIGRYVQSRHQTYNRLGNPIGDEWVQLAAVERPAVPR